MGAIVTFGGFTVTRDDDRLKIRRGFVSRVEATVPVSRVRAVRVVEGIFRRPFGLASLTIEVTGYADEASAARTLFPIVRLRDVEPFLERSCPSWPTTRAAWSRRRPAPPAAICCSRCWRARWSPSAPGSRSARSRCSRSPSALAYGHARWRAAAWRLANGRLAVRSMLLARTTVLAPARFRESHTLAQNLFQRRADLADLEVAFGKQTTARIRHLEAADAQRGLVGPLDKDALTRFR